MKILLFFNTETTGLPKQKLDKVTKNNLDNWPRILAIHYKIGYFEKRKRKIVINKKGYFLVKPSGFKIPKYITDINLITNKYANEKGSDIKKILIRFKEIIEKNKVKIIISHSINFHLRNIIAEFYRNNINIDFKKYILVDTIDYNHDYGYQKLTNLYELLYDRKFIKSHERKSNINIIIKCFQLLYNKKIKKNNNFDSLQLPKINTTKKIITNKNKKKQKETNAIRKMIFDTIKK